MRTRKSVVTFERPFTLNGDTGELPAGSYEIETDEEEIHSSDRSSYLRAAIYFYVKSPGSTRMLVIDPVDFDSAIQRDLA